MLNKNITDIFSLEGKCAVIIGGKGKIGLPMARALAVAGAKVYVVSPSATDQDYKIQKLNNEGLDVSGISVDQSNEKEVVSLLEKVTDDYKTPAILVNSGVERPMKKFFDDTVENWDRSMAVNARGLFICCRAFANAMANHGGGSIINVASIYGLVAPDPRIYEGTDIFTEPDYPYTKGGMIMFSKYLASIFADKNVRVNCIAPGGLFNHQEEPFLSNYINRVPMGRMANPDDLMGIAIYLASDASQYVTGTVIPIDGGLSIR